MRRRERAGRIVNPKKNAVGFHKEEVHLPERAWLNTWVLRVDPKTKKCS